MRIALALVLAGMTMTASASAQAPVLASKVIDNDEVTVWDITLKSGQQGPATPKDMDAVVMYLEGGTVKSEGGVRGETNDRKFGDAVFIPRGSNVRDTLVKCGPAHQVVVVAGRVRHRRGPAQPDWRASITSS